MLVRNFLTSCLFAGLATMSTAEPGYLIAQIDIADKEAFFGAYAAAAAPSLQDAGFKILVASPNAVAKEGSQNGNWTVVLEFPSPEAASAWYESDGYQQAIPLRQSAANSSNMILVEGFVPPSQ